jgi:hypothetical protein
VRLVEGDRRAIIDPSLSTRFLLTSRRSSFQAFLFAVACFSKYSSTCLFLYGTAALTLIALSARLSDACGYSP